jgi:hypothetical protein
MKDIVERANQWLNYEVANFTESEALAAELLDEAVTEIERLRACEYRCLEICPYCSQKLTPRNMTPTDDHSTP